MNTCTLYPEYIGGRSGMKIKLDKYAFAPTRAHAHDAGLDLKSPAEFVIGPQSSCTIPTGVHVQLPHGTAGLIVSKSGLNVKSSITSTGLIDEGYSGEIVVKLYNHGDVAYHVQRGDKISQIIIFDVRYEGVEIVDEIECGERGGNGFGSTGR